jgi:hypothetical protein
MEKECIEGVILVVSCQKHKETRLKEFKLSKNEYALWKVIYVIGDFFLDQPYVFDENLLTIRCEDSYLHLLKKVILAITIVFERYEIKQGILRAGDDLVFNEELLKTFLGVDGKHDFWGYSPMRQSYVPKPEELQETRYDPFMVNYYMTHPEDLEHPQHNLKGIVIKDYMKRPRIMIGPEGTMYYISKRSCQIMMDHFQAIHYNIFHFDDFSQSYPYTIEDCAVAYILYRNHISFVHNNHFVANIDLHVYHSPDFRIERYNTIAVATNKYK